jgi:hypothetical protein
MNNKILWAVFAIVVLGGVWYLSSRPQEAAETVSPAAPTTELVGTSTEQTTTTTTTKTTTTPVRTTTTKTVAPAKVTGVGPLSYLFGLKQALVCNVSTKTGVKRSGTMYVAEGKMRVNFGTSAMIDDGAYLYAWTSGASKGLKLLASGSASGSAIAMSGGFDPAYDLSYSCNPWTVNEGLFVPPASISFSNTL